MKKQNKTETLENQNGALKCALYDALFMLRVVADAEKLDAIDCQAAMRCAMARIEIGLDYAEAKND